MITESNDTILEANDSGLTSATGGTFFASGSIGDNPNVAPDLDVDFISFQLDAGDRVTIDIDGDQFGTGLDSVQRLFDSAGNELVVTDLSAAPGEPFSFDTFIDFTASVSDTYFVGISGFDNLNYDPFVEGSGFNDFDSTGDYDIEISVFDVISGTNGNDNLSGTFGDDLIDALGGNDTVNGRGGDDNINGGNGLDNLSGKAGDDLIDGGRGRDNLFGNSGNDTLLGGDSNDVLRGGGGSDRLQGNRGNDLLFGNGGNDVFVLDFGQEGETIVDFENGKDLFELPDFTDFSEVRIARDNSGGSTISVFGDVLATVQSTNPNQLGAEDFIVSENF